MYNFEFTNDDRKHDFRLLNHAFYLLEFEVAFDSDELFNFYRETPGVLEEWWDTAPKRQHYRSRLALLILLDKFHPEFTRPILRMQFKRTKQLRLKHLLAKFLFKVNDEKIGERALEFIVSEVSHVVENKDYIGREIVFVDLASTFSMRPTDSNIFDFIRKYWPAGIIPEFRGPLSFQAKLHHQQFEDTYKLAIARLPKPKLKLVRSATDC